VACADGQWRQIVTIEDALAGGCTLFDLDALRRKTALMISATCLCASLLMIKRRYSRSRSCNAAWSTAWKNGKTSPRSPTGHSGIAWWIGYDPSHRGDSAGCVVIAPPVVAGGKFRILERHQWKGMDFATQAESIRALTQKYNVEYIGIDATGLGQGVSSLCARFIRQRAISATRRK
jgi:hypothetical protein